jgi:hypothetical protein
MRQFKLCRGNTRLGSHTRLNIVPPLLLAATLSACIPYPRTHYDAPKISGTVLKGDIPVTSAELRLSDKYADEYTGQPFEALTVTTDTSGHFTIGPFQQFRAFLVIGDENAGFTLEIEHAGKTYLGIDAGGYGSYDADLDVICDLSNANDAYKPTTYCHVK